MKKFTLVCATLGLFAASVARTNAGIAGSAHDFAKEAWNVTADVCGPCHMAHGGDPGNQLIPLWSRAVPTAVWTPFVSPYGTTIGSPKDASLACLSCHDGTVAYNQLKGQTIGVPQYVMGDYVIGQGALRDLRGDHPISFDYNESVTKSPTNTLKLPSEILTTSGTLPPGNTLNGQTVQQAFLKKGTGLAGNTAVQCNSCHDVHRSTGDSGINSNLPLNSPNHNPLLVVFNLQGRLAGDTYGSSLCRSCHNK
jgi:hypothetical protein